MCARTVHHYDAFGDKDSLSTSNCAATMPTVSINGSPVTLAPGAFQLTAANAEGHSESRLYDLRFGVWPRGSHSEPRSASAAKMGRTPGCTAAPPRQLA